MSGILWRDASISGRRTKGVLIVVPFKVWQSICRDDVVTTEEVLPEVLVLLRQGFRICPGRTSMNVTESVRSEPFG